MGYGGGINFFAYVGQCPLRRTDPFGLKKFPITFWADGDKNRKYHIADADITLTGSDLCTDGKPGQLTLTTVLAEGPDWEKVINEGGVGLWGHLIDQLQSGFFILDGTDLEWKFDKNTPTKATATHVEVRPECPTGKQDGKYRLWLWADQQLYRKDVTNIIQEYKIEWSYRCEKTKTKGKVCCEEKEPLKVEISQVKDDPGGRLPPPPDWIPPGDRPPKE